MDDPWIGRLLSDRYEIATLIGRGGMAAVYRARDTRLGRFVAVKVFAIGAASDDARRRAEVDVLARLNHPNLVTLHDAFLAPAGSDAPSYLVMECVEGPDLRSTMEHGPLRGHVTALIAADVAEALVTVHTLGVVHRDLKPANILLAPTGLPTPTHRAKLADFGIAHLVGAERVTTAGVVVGTAAYLSPEQARGENPGPEADIYALGLLILECLTGKRAYPGSVLEAVSARIDHDPRIPPEIPVSWASLISQMTAREPGVRPTAAEAAVTARTIAPDLNDWSPLEPPGSGALESTAAMLPPTQLLPESNEVQPQPPSRQRRALIAVTAAGLLAAVVAGGITVALLLNPSERSAAPPHSSSPTATSSIAPVDTGAPEPSPSAPAQQTVSNAPAPAGGADNGNGNNGTGKGNNGNGNNGGKGNNGNGNGKNK